MPVLSSVRTGAPAASAASPGCLPAPGIVSPCCVLSRLRRSSALEPGFCCDCVAASCPAEGLALVSRATAEPTPNISPAADRHEVGGRPEALLVRSSRPRHRLFEIVNNSWLDIPLSDYEGHMRSRYMERTLEPELMEDERQALAYAKADFSTSNQWYVDHLLADYPEELSRALDIGCGPGDVILRLAAARPGVRVTAIDGSDAMIALARSAASSAQLDHRITLLQGRIPGFPLEEHSFDAILSKDLLHHLPDPMVLWAEAQRLGRPGAVVYVMDLLRPDTREAARTIVETVAGDELPILKEDFYASCAQPSRWTKREVR
jgi:ubiquinone/menaquinone biosynthesis C-methylase UbiE